MSYRIVNKQKWNLYIQNDNRKHHSNDSINSDIRKRTFDFII